MPEQLAIMSAMVLSLPMPWRIDTLFVAPTDLDDSQLAAALNVWQSRPQLRRLLIVSQADMTFSDLHDRYGVWRTEGVTILHTLDASGQPDRLVEWIKGSNVQGIAIVAAPYAMMRLYLKTVGQLLKNIIWVPIVPRPTYVGPEQIVVGTGMTSWALAAEEILRIQKGIEDGSLPNLDSLQQYMAWLWGQPCMANLQVTV